MSTPMANDPELDALLGAYALDALEPGERERVDAYLAGNPRARAEVDELRESAAALALAPVDEVVAPEDLWNRISETVGQDVRADEQPASLAEHRARRSRVAPWIAGLAVAASIAIVVLGARDISLQHRLDDAQAAGDKGIATAFDHAKSASGARELALAPAQGAEVARVVLLPDGTGYLKNDGMEALPPDKTYQLWALTGDPKKPTVISAGVLGADPKAAAFRANGPVHGFVVTVEDAPGVVSSTQPAFASATFA